MKIFYLPDLGEGLPEAEIQEWFVKEGDEVQADQPLVSVETAKALVEIPAPRSGRIVKLYAQPGETISTGAPLVEFESDESTEKGTIAGSLEIGGTVIEAENLAQPKAAGQPSSFIKALPAVRALAKRLHVDLASITPSGAGGQITAEDVEKASQAMRLHEKYKPLEGVQRAMALNMVRAHAEVVPVTIVDDAYLAWTPETDITLDIIQAIVAACQAEPNLNAWFDGKTLSRRIFKEVNLGLAMDSKHGLFVPTFRNVDQMSRETIRKTINQFKEKLNNRTITPEELQNATFALSNYGTFAGRYSTPVVVPPIVAILGTGRLREEPVVIEGEIVIRKVLPLSLTFEHRAITGGEASRFLGVVIQHLGKG